MTNHKCPENKTVIRAGKLVRGCDVCLASKLQQGDMAAGHRRFQQREYRKDLVQPNEPRDFVRAYGADRARENGFSDEQIRKYS